MWNYWNGFNSFMNTNKIKVHISFYQKKGKILNPQFVLLLFVSGLFRNTWSLCVDQADHWTRFSIFTTSLCVISIIRFWVDFEDTCKRHRRVCGWSVYSECIPVWAHTRNGNCSSHKPGRRQILSLQLPWKLTQSCKGKLTYQDWLWGSGLPIPSAVNSA